MINIPTGTYTLYIGGTDEDAAATGDLDITGDVTLTGTGATTSIINGYGIDRVLQISGATATIENVKITGGTAGIVVDSSSSITVINSTISDNAGSGIDADYSSSVALINSTVSDNASSGISAYFASIALTNSTVSRNTGHNGGGIWAGTPSAYTTTTTVTLTNSAISGNRANIGGGIYSDSAVVGLYNVTIANNVAVLFLPVNS